MKKKLIFDNLGLKITSVLLAIVLWMFVTSRGQSEISIDVPLEFKNIPQGLEMVNHNIKMISLNIKGQERLINTIKPADIKVYIDLSKTKKGENVYYITREDIKTPHGIIVTNINPSNVKILTEETILKTVKIITVTSGDIQKGFHIKSLILSPQTVEIEGIKSEVRKIQYLKTEPVDITGANETFTQNVKFNLNGKNIRTKVNEVQVRVVIEEMGK